MKCILTYIWFFCSEIISIFEQFKFAKSSIFEISDKIVINFNLEYPSNKLDVISVNCDGNLIDVKLIQCEKLRLSIIVKFDNFSNNIFFKFEQFLHILHLLLISILSSNFF